MDALALALQILVTVWLVVSIVAAPTLIGKDRGVVTRRTVITFCAVNLAILTAMWA